MCIISDDYRYVFYNLPSAIQLEKKIITETVENPTIILVLFCRLCSFIFLVTGFPQADHTCLVSYNSMH